MREKSSKIFIFLAICFYCVSIFTLYKGYDKITNYYSSETSYSLNRNAYVGGDAYNYIINGNYATGYFVLSMGCLVTGMIATATSVIIKIIPDGTERITEMPENNDNILMTPSE